MDELDQGRPDDGGGGDGPDPREDRGKRAQGLYTDDEVEELTALKLQAFATRPEIDPELARAPHAHRSQLEHLGRLPHRDHRSGSGAAASSWRRGWWALRAPLHGPPALPAGQINLYLRYLCHNLVREMVRQQLDETALRNRSSA